MSARVARQHLRVYFADADPVDVHTNPFDHDWFAITAKKHDWPSQQANPVGYLLFLAWHAARRTDQIARTETYEAFRARAEDIEVFDEERVDPTEPAPGAG
jgi:hypothetical protein